MTVAGTGCKGQWVRCVFFETRLILKSEATVCIFSAVGTYNPPHAPLTLLGRRPTSICSNQTGTHRSDVPADSHTRAFRVPSVQENFDLEAANSGSHAQLP